MSSPKKRTYNKKQKIKAIQSATVDLVPKRGYFNLTTKEIAEKSGISIGLLYKYFPGGKIEIIKTIAEEIAQDALDKFKMINGHLDLSLDIDIHDFVRNSILRAVTDHRENKDMILAIEMAYLSDPEAFGFHALDNYEGYNNRVAGMFITLAAKRLGCEIEEKFSKFVIQIVDAAIHRHVTLIPSAPTDKEFADALTGIIFDLLSTRKEISRQ
ncbi:MAG: TetR/AcrR family transcriptional regulator [Candidatus Hermodarchaeota archaeon]